MSSPAAKLAHSTAARPRVLIVDDDDTTRRAATGFLCVAGFDVSEAASGAAALKSVTETQPDLILLDVEMPDMDGIEVCKELRKMPALQHTPILMLTVLENNDCIDDAYFAGATDFASKPINWKLLGYRLRYMHRTSLTAEQLVRQQTNFADAQRIAQIGSWTFDCLTKTTTCTDQLFRIFGLKPGECTPSLSFMLNFVHEEDRDRIKRSFAQAEEFSQALSVDHRLLLEDGSSRSVRQHIEPEFNADGVLVKLNATVQDFTERRKVEDRVHRLAYYDTLTNLPNRIFFQEQLELALQQARKDKSQVAVLYFDLDDFKRVNDTFGHAVGDKLLQEVGVRLTDSLRIAPTIRKESAVHNCIARMGGDEFIIILNNIARSADAEVVAERIVNVVSSSYNVDEYELFTSPSIGIALYPRDGEDAENLLKNADMAMYEAKRTGKSMYMVHSEEMRAKTARRYELDRVMRSAIDNDEFSVHYQVQLDLKSGEIFSAEALVRWHSETLGSVSPAEFVSVAEDNGMIISLGEWVLRKSCQQVKQWMENDALVQRVAVNISAMQFMRPDFPEVVSNILQQCELPAERLELEITESLLASDLNHAINTLQKLHEIGVTLSIDDFGTGYSSLSQLKHFPIDRLKIDQSFIYNIIECPDDAAITRAVIAMSKSMNIQVLAEGVETAEQLQFLLANGCDEVQGYLFSKPVSAAQLEKDMPQILSQLDELF